MNILKKLTIFMLSGALLMSVIPLSAKADTTFSYALRDDGTAEISCINKSIQTAEIPSEVDGHAVTALAPNCFSECTSLKEVSIPETVTEFGEYAFYACSALEEIRIPASVIQIGNYAFETTENMLLFSVDENNPAYQSPDGVLYDKSGETLIKYPEARPDTEYSVLDACRTVENWAFIGAQYLEQIDLKQVQNIGTDAFYFCVSLKNITVPEGVSELNGAVFSYCESLEQAVLPATLKSIGENCFYSCTSLKSVNLPEGLEKIGAYSFCHCPALTALVIPESLTSMNINCMGYCYDEEKDEYFVQDNFTLYVHKDSPAFRYAVTNQIHYELIQTGTVYYILIAVCLIIIVILIIAIVRVLKNRRSES
ncbi:MAG: leucine-rich repeat domain-containing protein [Oscillospiraceae bacterium]|nr:leucine-rich repeat domain-containing protein [Oscillospiraceae bacterium]